MTIDQDGQRVIRTRPLSDARAELRRVGEHAVVRRRRSAAQKGIPRDEVESYRVAVIPRNRNRMAKLPKKRRQLFEAHLRNTIAEARARLAASSDPSAASTLNEPVFTAPTPEILEAERALLGQGCAACRGACCAAGKNHAFVRVDTMVPYLQRHPTHDDDTIVARYLSYVGERTTTGGCLFQEETGCSLPRDLRGDVCNRYHCSGLEGLRNRFGVGDPVRAYFVHREGHELNGGRFIQISVGSKK